MKSVYKKSLLISVLVGTFGLYGTIIVFAAPPNPGGYTPAETLDPECSPGQSVANGDPFDCFVVSASGGSGWSLTGDTGTDGGLTNFIGTIDARDFVIKTDGSEIGRFGQDGNVAFGDVTIASGYAATSFGSNNFARSFGETSLGINGIDLIPLSSSNFDSMDRLLSIGNGDGLGGMNDRHNAYTLWKDGSFAYNDDNFQNDNLGVEQNMFYFNYGNHDGLGGAQTKRAIRLGSAVNDEWDINSVNVGDQSIAIGFAIPNFGITSPKASGTASFALGAGTEATSLGAFAAGVNSKATGNVAIALGFDAQASGDNGVAIGDGSIASGKNSVAIGYQSESQGERSLAFGTQDLKSYGFEEFAFGAKTTSYAPSQVQQSDTASPTDRLFIIGKGGSSGSDAFTILKNGQTGVGINNFEATVNGSIFQVGDGSTNVIGHVDNADGEWKHVSDRRAKKNIQPLSYGLDVINQLNPVSFTYKRNDYNTIGFIAQEVLDIIPEAVSGSEENGYSMSYQTLTPAIVQSIQELDLKLSTIEAVSGIDAESFFQRITKLVKDTVNSLEEIVVNLVKADRIETQELCVDGECFTGDDIRELKNLINTNADETVEIVQEIPSEEIIEEDSPEETSSQNTTPEINLEGDEEDLIPGEIPPASESLPEIERDIAQ